MLVEPIDAGGEVEHVDASIAPVTSTEPSAQPTPDLPSVAGGEPSAEPTAAQTEAWREHLSKQWGLDSERFTAPEQAIDYTLQGFLALQQQAAEREAYLQQQLEALQRAQQVVAQPAQAPSQQPEQKNAWNPPEYNPQWSRLLQLNPATGLYEAIVPGSVNPEIVQKANARAEWERQWQAEFAKNPHEFIYKGIEDKVKAAEEAAFKRAVEYFQSQQSQQTVVSTVKSTIDAHKDWLYQKDALGNPGVDAMGRPLLTEKGQRYAQAVDMLARSGVQDPVVQNEIALQMIGHAAQSATNPANRIAQFAGAPAARNFAEALHTGSRNGSNQPVVAGAIAPSTTPGSFLAMAEQTMREQGMSLSSGSVTPV